MVKITDAGAAKRVAVKALYKAGAARQFPSKLACYRNNFSIFSRFLVENSSKTLIFNNLDDTTRHKTHRHTNCLEVVPRKASTVSGNLAERQRGERSQPLPGKQAYRRSGRLKGIPNAKFLYNTKRPVWGLQPQQSLCYTFSLFKMSQMDMDLVQAGVGNKRLRQPVPRGFYGQDFGCNPFGRLSRGWSSPLNAA